MTQTLRRPPNSGPNFYRQLGAASFGTILAQAISLLSVPVITRVYEPEDVGVYAIFMILPNIVIPNLAGKFDVAIPVPRSDAVAERGVIDRYGFGARRRQHSFDRSIAFQKQQQLVIGIVLNDLHLRPDESDRRAG